MRFGGTGWGIEEIEQFLPVPVLDIVVLAVPAVDESLHDVAIIVQHAKRVVSAQFVRCRDCDLHNDWLDVHSDHRRDLLYCQLAV